VPRPDAAVFQIATCVGNPGWPGLIRVVDSGKIAPVYRFFHYSHRPVRSGQTARPRGRIGDCLFRGIKRGRRSCFNSGEAFSPFVHARTASCVCPSSRQRRCPRAWSSFGVRTFPELWRVWRVSRVSLLQHRRGRARNRPSGIAELSGNPRRHGQFRGLSKPSFCQARVCSFIVPQKRSSGDFFRLIWLTNPRSWSINVGFPHASTSF